MLKWYHDVAPLRRLHGVPRVFLGGFPAVALLVAALSGSSSIAAEPEGATQFRKDIEPVLVRFCFDCHNSGLKKGGVAFDHFKSDAALLENRELWWKTLKMLRAGIMPPKNKPSPTVEQIDQIGQWIKRSV